jgi:hypothetical protein
MATLAVLESAAPYYAVRVAFDGREFNQLLTSDNNGNALQSQLQAYADEYEYSYLPPANEAGD